MSNQLRRILTALVAAPVVIGIAYVGTWAFALLVGALGLLAQSELYAMARTAGARPHRPAGFALGAGLVGAVLWPPGFPLMGALMTAFVAVAPVVMGQERFLESFSITVTGAVYPTGLLASLVALREARGPAVDADGAFWLVLLTFFLVWATDIFAYYVGRAVGRTPLAPTISPNKTWEGSLGGFAAAALVAVGFKLTVLGVLGWDDVAALAILGGAVSQVGDLAESQLKRSTGADDAGAILPGHGGVFDRFDAMVVAAPLIYLYLRYAAQLF